MSRRLLIDLSELTEDQRLCIVDAASAHGFEPVFSASGPLPDAEVYFGGNPAILDAAASLKWVNLPSAGADHFLKVMDGHRGVALTTSSGAYGVTIAEHVTMIALELLRRRADHLDLVRRHQWVRTLPVRALHGSRVTLLGAGDIGREIARRFRAFGPARIVGVNRTGAADGALFDAVYDLSGLDDALPETDLLILSLPDTPLTRGVMDARRLKLLPEDAFLINVGRGSAIDQAALLAQLRAGRFAGVSLDVFETEPLPADDPVWDFPRLLATPHIAGNMTLPYTVERIAAMFLENFERYCEGRPLLRIVDPARGY